MPSPFRELGRKAKSLFQSHSRNGQPERNTNRSGDVGEVAAPISPTQSWTMVDLSRGEGSNGTQDTGLVGPSTTNPAVVRVGHGTLPPHDVPGAFSNDPDDLGRIPSGLRQPLVQRPRPAFDNPQSLQLPSAPVSPLLASSNSYFSNAHDFTLSNLTVSNSYAYSKTLFEYLSPHIAQGAVHDSSERCDAPACHEETRVAIREEIVGWIKYDGRDGEPKKIMWLRGPQEQARRRSQVLLRRHVSGRGYWRPASSSRRSRPRETGARSAVSLQPLHFTSLYRHILKRAHNPDDASHLVVKWILSVYSAIYHPPLKGVTPATFWREFLEDDEGKLSYRLAPVTSDNNVDKAKHTSFISQRIWVILEIQSSALFSSSSSLHHSLHLQASPFRIG
ncbi:hypothetical protein FA13DRAFT_1818587 [Coprinellus micaceus]|uniref:Uncharacterized protein n=1 Tax=Coprinellus micaceus TaxID=71717 RepID=A0A4Y7SMS9_COPMI|nr:hypothetical protein FA13DRAFT_1818587 [Coprinellus micaceus]